MNLTSEPKYTPSSVDHVVERLFGEAVAGQEEAVLAAVIDREAPHALEPVDAGRAVCQVGLEQDLRVGGGRETDASLLEFPPQLDVVVDLAVEDQRAVADGERLVGARVEIDDAQPGVEQSDIGAAVPEGQHGPDGRGRGFASGPVSAGSGRGPCGPADVSGDSAHAVASMLRLTASPSAQGSSPYVHRKCW